MLVLAFGAFSANADKFVHDGSVLPAGAQAVLKQNFRSDVSVVKVEKDFGKVSEYDVVLTDGTEVTFDAKGNWKDVEVAPYSNVPAGFILRPIRNFLDENYNGMPVVGIEKDAKNIEVTLASGVEIKFDKAGRFLKYED